MSLSQAISGREAEPCMSGAATSHLDNNQGNTSILFRTYLFLLPTLPAARFIISCQ